LIVSTLLVNQSGNAEGAWQVPWYWHLVVGNFAFAVVFLATDPTTTPLTATGRWLHGILIGTLTVVLRVVDPSHPEGTLFAVLLAGLAVPLIDHLVVRVAVRRNRKSPLSA
jgi:Na+-transporting NADH:ubiquinone oxidoreductase subunit B